jgi:carbonic anhydrase
MKTLTREDQEKISPDAAVELLKKGNERFVKNMRAERDLVTQVTETSLGQFPFATILSCMDSRTSAELIFDQGIGDIFSIRIAGNVLNDDILGSMEFASKLVGTKVILILGHTKCGAVSGACDNVEMGNLTALLQKIQPAIDRETSIKENRNSKNPDFVNRITELNVRMVMERVTEQSPILAELEKEGKIRIIGGFYDVDSGKVEFYKEAKGIS